LELSIESSRKAAAEADRNPWVVSVFRFPPSLSAKHEEELRKRGISKEFALASGVRMAADNELRELNFQVSLPHEERSKGLQGICFPYVDLELRAEALQKSEPKRKFVVIGLQGVNIGWHRDKQVVPTADGGHEKKPTGPPHLIDDLQSVEWNKRTVYICFD
jgi:hypothetical protein